MNFNYLVHLLTDFNQKKLLGKKAHFEIAPDRVKEPKITPKSTNKAAVLLLFYPIMDEAYFSLIQRPTYNGSHSGQIALPGGKWEKKDKTIIQTALREAWEEINIEKKNVEILGELSGIYIPPSNFDVTPVLGISRNRPNFKPNQREVEEILEIPLVNLLRPETLKETEVSIENGGKLKTPYFDLSEKVVWGATAMILNEIKHYITES